MRRGGQAVLLVGWLLALAALGWMVSQRLRVGTDLRSFMPAPTTPDQRLLMEQVGDGPGSRLLLLSIAGRPDAQLARLSQGLVEALRHDPRYRQVLNGSFDLGALDPGLLPYRYLLSPTLDTQALDESYLGDQLQQRLDDLSSPAAGLLEGLLPRDPTLEMLKLAQRWAPAKSPQMHDGVWFTPRHEALLLVQTVAAGFDPGAQQAA
ncbi:MAG: xanthomonadin transporter, partial [Xanthomonadaceae bacterium]|nr:xanthomonadin transporter [Xanthomonadaceae bacterium]